MKKFLIGIFLLPLTLQAQSIEECWLAAESNYPQIKQYDLIEKTIALLEDNVSKGWLPQLSAIAQASYQSDVVSWPEQIKSVYNSMGIDMKGMKKDQYKIGVDVSQLVFDGGALRSQREIVRQQGAVETAQTEVTMYQIRRRVNELFFGILLLDEQIRLNSDLQAMLDGNEQKLKSMYLGGTAAQSDYQTVKAERLNVKQQGENLVSQRQSMAMILSVLCGIDVKNIVKPEYKQTATDERINRRPELKVIDEQLKLTKVQESSLGADLMPKLSVFASAFYGYPGYNMFESIQNHQWSLNGMVGARLTWNIGALYTRKNDKAKIDMQRSMLNVQRETFLFNNKLEELQQNENIKRYHDLMKSDDEIIALRSAVRKAAESKLEHGIIDPNDLVKEINSENNAKVQQTIHEIEMLKEMYDVIITTNN